MKRYIHASFDVSMPEWLRKKLSRFGNTLKDNLLKKYRVALDKVQFVDHPTSQSLPVYNLDTDYGTAVYIPGVNDDDSYRFNGRNRKLGSLAKSRLPEIANDIVYMDLSEIGSTFDKKEKYKDPRYTYRYNDRGDYAGQFKRKRYLGNGEYGEEEWTETGKLPSNESRARDKSGYRIPSPEEMITNYYTKFPERMTDKVDRIYERLLEVRSELASADISTNADNISRAYNRFSYAVDHYNQLIGYFREEEGSRKLGHKFRFDSDYYTQQFSQLTRTIRDDLDEIEQLIGI